MNLEAIRGEMKPVTGEGSDYDALLDAIGDASVVCVGEASHGTHEFYRERASRLPGCQVVGLSSGA